MSPTLRRYSWWACASFVAAVAFAPPAHAAEPTLKEAYKGDFLMGVAINRTVALGEDVRADNVNRRIEQVKKDTALVIEQFNQISPENDLKWALIHPNEGPEGYNWKPADAFVDFGVKHDMYIVGHTLVWHGQTPNWVFQGNEPPPAEEEQGGRPGPGRRRGGFGFRGPRASREQLLERMRDHIHAVVGRYKGKIHSWDVVNEALSDGGPDVLRDSLWRQIIGDDFIEKAFQYAHEADPDAILRYNDYSLENPGKRQKLIKLIKSLQEKGVPVHAIGTQTHISATSPSYEQLDLAFTEMAALGLPIHVTELDVNTAERGQRSTTAEVGDNASVTGGGQVSEADRRQSEQYANLFKVMLKHKEHVKVVTFWGVNDGVSWRAAGKPLLFDSEDKPKPAFEAVIRVASEK
jgi:endo-1,4-beta-xylanase